MVQDWAHAGPLMIPTAEPAPPIGWAIVELLGHRRLAGYVSTEPIADVPFLRIATPTGTPEGGDPYTVTLVPPASIYAITPATEETARRTAASSSFRPQPVSPYEVGRPELGPDQVADWLRDEDRLGWAVANSRGHRDGSTAEDEAEAARIIAAIRVLDLPF